MGEQPHPVTHGPSVGAQVHAQYPRLAIDHRHQARAGSKDGGLTGAVRSLQEHDLADTDIEIDAGQSGKAPEETDRTAETDNGLHGLGFNGTGAPVPPTNPLG